MKTNREILGENISTLRKDKGLTQEDLAKKAGLTLGTINRYEKGRQPPRESNLKSIAEALGTTPEDLRADKSDRARGVPVDILRALCDATPTQLNLIRQDLGLRPDRASRKRKSTGDKADHSGE